MVYTFDISNLDYLSQLQNLYMFEISKVYDIGLQRSRYWKIRVCGKDSIPFSVTSKEIQNMFFSLKAS